MLVFFIVLVVCMCLDVSTVSTEARFSGAGFTCGAHDVGVETQLRSSERSVCPLNHLRHLSSPCWLSFE